MKVAPPFGGLPQEASVSVNAIRIEIDPRVAQKRYVPGRGQAEEPERNRDAHKLLRVRVVCEHAQRLQLDRRKRGWNHIAVQHRFIVFPDLDERLLAGEPLPCLRELHVRVVVRRELGIDVVVDEERGAADRGDGQEADNDNRRDEDRNPRPSGLLAHVLLL